MTGWFKSELLPLYNIMANLQDIERELISHPQKHWLFISSFVFLFLVCDTNILHMCHDRNNFGKCELSDLNLFKTRTH